MGVAAVVALGYGANQGTPRKSKAPQEVAAGYSDAVSCLGLRRRGGPPMSQHPNARLTSKGRETLVSRVKAGLGVARTARGSRFMRPLTQAKL